jgi:hypothetical protein
MALSIFSNLTLRGMEEGQTSADVRNSISAHRKKRDITALVLLRLFSAQTHNNRYRHIPRPDQLPSL